MPHGEQPETLNLKPKKLIFMELQSRLRSY